MNPTLTKNTNNLKKTSIASFEDANRSYCYLDGEYSVIRLLSQSDPNQFSFTYFWMNKNRVSQGVSMSPKSIGVCVVGTIDGLVEAFRCRFAASRPSSPAPDGRGAGTVVADSWPIAFESSFSSGSRPRVPVFACNPLPPPLPPNVVPTGVCVSVFAVCVYVCEC